MTGSYSGSVVDLGTGKMVYAHNSTQGYIPASTMKLLTSTAAMPILGTRAHLQDVGCQPETGPDHSGRRWGSVPFRSKLASDYPSRATDLRTGAGHGESVEAGPGQESQPGYDATRCSRARPGIHAGRASTVTRSHIRRRCGSTKATWVTAVSATTTRPRKLPPLSRQRCPSKGSRSPRRDRPMRRHPRRSLPGSPRCLWSGSWNTC